MEIKVSQPEYDPLSARLLQIEGANGVAARRIYDENRELFEAAPGASKNHHTWPGGYADHVAEVLNIAAMLYDTLSSARPLLFTKSDALLVMFLHDLEKPFRYTYTEEGTLVKVPELDTKAAKATKRQELIADYGIELNALQANALRYVETVPDVDYTPDRRIMGELGALCHCADVLSARLWYDHPLSQGDSWVGSGRVNPSSSDITLLSEIE